MRDDVLFPVLNASLPGLTTDQATELLERADGNPRFLEEIIRFCQENPKYFDERNLSHPLTNKGLREILNVSTDLYQLVARRLRDAPLEVRTVITLDLFPNSPKSC